MKLLSLKTGLMSIAFLSTLSSSFPAQAGSDELRARQIYNSMLSLQPELKPHQDNGGFYDDADSLFSMRANRAAKEANEQYDRLAKILDAIPDGQIYHEALNRGVSPMDVREYYDRRNGIDTRGDYERQIAKDEAHKALLQRLESEAAARERQNLGLAMPTDEEFQIYRQKVETQKLAEEMRNAKEFSALVARSEANMNTLYDKQRADAVAKYTMNIEFELGRRLDYARNAHDIIYYFGRRLKEKAIKPDMAYLIAIQTIEKYGMPEVLKGDLDDLKSIQDHIVKWTGYAPFTESIDYGITSYLPILENSKINSAKFSAAVETLKTLGDRISLASHPTKIRLADALARANIQWDTLKVRNAKGIFSCRNLFK